MPESRTVQHVDNYHGTLVADPYRWLEDFTSTEVKEWVNAQNYFTESFLENPNRLAIRENLESIWVSESISTPYKVQDKTFYYFNSGDWQQSKFMVKDCDACDPRVLLDPNTFSTDGTIALASVSVSPNAELLAFAISDGGSDWRSWKVLNIESGEELDNNLVWSKFSEQNGPLIALASSTINILLQRMRRWQISIAVLRSCSILLGKISQRIKLLNKIPATPSFHGLSRSLMMVSIRFCIHLKEPMKETLLRLPNMRAKNLYL